MICARFGQYQSERCLGQVARQGSDDEAHPRAHAVLLREVSWSRLLVSAVHRQSWMNSAVRGTRCTPRENRLDCPNVSTLLLVSISSFTSKIWGEGPASVAVVTSPLRCAGINRHGAGDERALRERSNDPLGLESCAEYREAHSEAWTEDRRGGYPAPKRCNPDADALVMAEGNMSRSDSASSCSVRRSRRPQTRLETSCTRTGRPRRHLRPNRTAGRRAKARATRPARTSARSHTAA